MSSVYLRFAGPLQSWAGPKITGNFSQTELIPTRSALEGFLAACLGIPRGEQTGEFYPQWFQDVIFSVRSDNTGRICSEYQTIGNRDEDEEYRQRLFRFLSGGKNPSMKDISFTPDQQNSTSQVRRTFLSGAEFIVQIQCENHLTEIDKAVTQPVFVPYLGKKAFSPTFPFYLGVGGDEQLRSLPRYKAKKPDGQSETVAIWQLDSLGRSELSKATPEIVDSRKEWLLRIQNELQRHYYVKGAV